MGDPGDLGMRGLGGRRFPQESKRVSGRPVTMGMQKQPALVAQHSGAGLDPMVVKCGPQPHTGGDVAGWRGTRHHRPDTGKAAMGRQKQDTAEYLAGADRLCR